MDGTLGINLLPESCLLYFSKFNWLIVIILKNSLYLVHQIETYLYLRASTHNFSHKEKTNLKESNNYWKLFSRLKLLHKLNVVLLPCNVLYHWRIGHFYQLNLTGCIIQQSRIIANKNIEVNRFNNNNNIIL